ncbi:sigma-70 family RNA polymerase sigma factor [Aliivibrio fischeri]|uniref:RNA polymerase sigma factor n=1 Tax=Aliivibrio fischeri (strain ATCC 700601 / ES114) TaxID=312309 RepID=Q5DYR1_ALIF1|nr:sigma-70 family RNA polymerase sigma factor [Aliivibrio fischeri]AAW88085.1 sigma-Q factor RpoQ, quorum-sensing regulated RpoS-like sigma subunit [Aliivibrio fischeri ES114]KLU80559.1 RNA polymerase sigma70 [Aliivibrio fischeri]MBP3139757.1 sigma-70 family RNA polymerase sigma factor [Aliivibrio fischeri]MBP3154142.1 sigma-70 family RNA polymerase sigma factor [Aliivibrio fischeri]MCE7554948.1 sigma-70 family RNA polymerase sigma factor [Aliivibrio fischeri]
MAYAKLDMRVCEEQGLNDSYSLYLKEINRYQLLTAEEELAYSRLYKKGDVSARNTLIESNLRLVVKVANKYRKRNQTDLAILDIIEEGNLGLIKAIDKFNPELGYRFSTYAVWWIRESIESALFNHSRTVRLPVHITKELNTYLRAARELSKSLKREPSIRDISTYCEEEQIKVSKIISLIPNQLTCHSACSDELSPKFFELSSNNKALEPDSSLSQNNLEMNLSSWIDSLNYREKEIIINRYGLFGCKVKTLEDLGKDLDLSKERVRQIQSETLIKLNTIFKKNKLDLEIALG